MVPTTYTHSRAVPAYVSRATPIISKSEINTFLENYQHVIDPTGAVARPHQQRPSYHQVRTGSGYSGVATFCKATVGPPREAYEGLRLPEAGVAQAAQMLNRMRGSAEVEFPVCWCAHSVPPISQQRVSSDVMSGPHAPVDFLSITSMFLSLFLHRKRRRSALFLGGNLFFSRIFFEKTEQVPTRDSFCYH